MTSVAVLERLTLVAPLGVRFRDEATGTFVTDALSVVVYPAHEPERRTQGMATTAASSSSATSPECADDGDSTATDAALRLRARSARPPRPLSALQRRRQAAAAAHPDHRADLAALLAAVDPDGRRGTDGCRSSPPPSRSAPDGMGALRAELLDAGTGGPPRVGAAGSEGRRAAAGDRHGRRAAGASCCRCSTRKPLITLGSPGSIANCRSRSRAGRSTSPFATAGVSRSRRSPTSSTSSRNRPPRPGSNLTADRLDAGHAAVRPRAALATGSGGAGTSTLLITPAGSPP